MISKEELLKEELYLEMVTNDIKSKISDLGQNIYEDDSKIQEFKKYLWDSKKDMDPVEIRVSVADSNLQVRMLEIKWKYLTKLMKSENSPYFGRIDFLENGELFPVYIGITYVDKGSDHLVYDWRAPISSMFYDFGVGPAQYETQKQIISGVITKRRQYKIENAKLIRIFDNDVNVVDDMLQEVLSSGSGDKMKNIVNTIQKEQNEIIRDINNKNLIVQGIAGSGKTSVALHRIAFLLYKQETLSSKDVLIFSPNNIFSEYISNVLPELGEENVVNTTFSEFESAFIKGYKYHETFTKFVERFYREEKELKELNKLKISDEFKNIIDEYIDNLIKNIKIMGSINGYRDYSEEELNTTLKIRYSSLPLAQRLEVMSEKIAIYNREKNKRKYVSILKSMMNISLDIKNIYRGLFKSNAFVKRFNRELTDFEINSFLNKTMLNYEDSIALVYIRGLIEGFPYNNRIKQVVIDEGQDYTILQYFILKKIFAKAAFTILGDVNQTINPYYKYETLSVIVDILNSKTKYLELTKTYRSSEEIIEFTNKILNLKHVSAIRRENNIPVVKKEEFDIKEQIKEDIEKLSNKYKSIAIITKTEGEALELYEKLNIKNLTILKETTEEFDRDLVILPSYMSKGLEFDAVISYNEKHNKYKDSEKYLYYVVCTRAQHELIIYN